MNECKGIFGWMFGHRFQAMHNSIPPSMDGTKISGATEEGVAQMVRAMTKIEVVGIYCSRCGAKQTGRFKEEGAC